MTVKDLIAALQALPPHADVILQKDAEGNGYSPLYAVDGNCIYQPGSTYSGDVFSTDWTAADAGFASEREWKAFQKKYDRCVVLSPVN